MDSKTQLQYADFEEGYLSRYIVLADTKAAFAFSLNAGLIAFLLARTSNLTDLRDGTADWILWLALALPLISGALCLWVVVPRLGRSGEGIIFWEGVRAHPSEQAYIAAIKALESGSHAEARLSHCYAVAGVARSKYRVLRAAMVLSGIAVLAVGVQAIASAPLRDAQAPNEARAATAPQADDSTNATEAAAPAGNPKAGEVQDAS